MILDQLSKKEQKRRKFILEGNLWKVVYQISLPLVIYGLFNYLYGFFDLVLVSFVGTNEIASVVFIDEIKNAIMAFGFGIAAGGTVIVARHYGAGDIDEARKNAATSFILAIIVGVSVVFFTVGFGRTILLLLNAPAEIIEAGIGYYNIQMISTAIIAINSVFIGLEKAKGNTSKVLILNILAMIVKLILSSIFVFQMGKGATFVALATLIAQTLIMFVALYIMFSKKNSFQIRFSEIKLKKQYILPILSLGIPVFFGKFLFSMGKVAVNSMAAAYGPLAVAAFGIALKMGGGAGAMAMALEEGETSIISQNLGNKNTKRAMKTYVVVQIYGLILGSIGLIIVNNLYGSLVPIFTSNNDDAFKLMIADLYFWEKFSAITSTSIAIITGMFIGFRRTKVSFVINAFRLFVVRVPMLWVLITLGTGYIALGYAMFVSNVLTLTLAIIMLLIFFSRIKKQGFSDLVSYNTRPKKVKFIPDKL